MSEQEQKRQASPAVAQGESSGDAGASPATKSPLLQRKISRRLIQREKDKGAPQATATDKKYAAAGGQHAYTVGSRDVVVFLPPGGVKGPKVNVFLFLHGNGQDHYTGAAGNTAKEGKIAQAIAGGDNVVGLAPAVGAGADWANEKKDTEKEDKKHVKWAPGDFKAIADGALAQLSKDLTADPPLEAGHVSLAAHSGGGRGIGQAALDFDAEEVTLQDSGYGKFDGKLSVNYNASWDKLGQWFLAGTPAKTLRVIAHDKKGSGDAEASTRYVTENKTKGFSAEALKLRMSELVADKTLTAPLTFADLPGDTTPRAGSKGGMKLERKLTATRADGKLQGTLYVFHLDTSHGEVKGETMAAAVKGGGDDFGKLDLKPGDYLVTAKQANVRDDKDLTKMKKGEDKKDVIIPRSDDTVKVTEFSSPGVDVFAKVEGWGWTKLSNLKPAAAAGPAGGDKK